MPLARGVSRRRGAGRLKKLAAWAECLGLEAFQGGRSRECLWREAFPGEGGGAHVGLEHSREGRRGTEGLGLRAFPGGEGAERRRLEALQG